MSSISIQNPPRDEVAELRAENAALKLQLEESAKSTNQYLQNVAHQLTAPLNAIKWGFLCLTPLRGVMRSLPGIRLL
jgi:signal transduction histidine kinase